MIKRSFEEETGSAQEIVKKKGCEGKCKVPTLREIARTGIERHHSESFQRQTIRLTRKVVLQSSPEDLIIDRNACKQSH